MTGKMTIKVAAITLALFLFLLLISCGGKRTSLVNRVFGLDKSPPVSQEYNTADVLAELDAMQCPPEVNPSVFSELKVALRDALTAICSGKFTATPPTGPENEIPDFAFTENGDGTNTFTWSYTNVGDYDQNGIVGISDITPIAQFFNSETTGDEDAEVVDGNGDGVINIADITPLAMHFGNNVTDYLIEGSEDGEAGWGEVGIVDFSIGVEGSRKVFLSVHNIFAYRFFRIFARDATGAIGAGSPVRTYGPSAQAAAEYLGGLDVQFYGVGSDPLMGNVAFVWDFESDGNWDTPGGPVGAAGPMPDTSAGEQSPLHVYSNEGIYTATLRVYDTRGNWSTATVTVPVFSSMPASAPPAVTALAFDLTGAAPFTVSFLGMGEDPDGGALSYEWNFGDGTANEVGQRAHHTYTTPGTYIARCTATDADGDAAQATLTLKVCPAGYIPDMPPSAILGIMSDPGDTPSTLLSMGADMDDGTLFYSWDMGDNSSPLLTDLVNYDYAVPGVYHPIAHIWDDETGHSTANATVVYGSVTDAPPSAMALAYISSGTQNMRVQFRGFGDDPDGTICAFAWDFDGDGVYGDFGITDEDPIVIYTATGTWDVGLQVTDGDGESSYASVRINVHPCATGTGTPAAPPGTEPKIPATPPPPGDWLNARCYPCPLSIAHGPDGGVLYVIYNTGTTPLESEPLVEQIQQFGSFFGFWSWLGLIDNYANGHDTHDIVEYWPQTGGPEDPPAPPTGADVKPWESWEAYKITRPLDGPTRTEKFDIKFKLKRMDGSAFATQTCSVYAHHSAASIVEPAMNDTVSGIINSTIQVDPTGSTNAWNFISVEPGMLINVYYEVDGVVSGLCTRIAETNIWSYSWNTSSHADGVHNIRALLYHYDDPQPWDAEDHGPYFASEPVSVTIDNSAYMNTQYVDLSLSAPSPMPVQTPVTVTLATLDGAGGPAIDSFFDVFYTVSPARSETMSQLPGDTDARIVPMADQGNGTYTAPFICDVSGELAFSAIVVDTRTGDKVPFLNDIEIVEFTEGIAQLVSVQGELTGWPCDSPVAFYGEDSYGNLIRNPNPANYSRYSTHPAILPGMIHPFAEDPSLLICDFTANAWVRGDLYMEDIVSGATSDAIFVGYPPWRMHAQNVANPLLPELPADFYKNATGIPSGAQFCVQVDIRMPEAMVDGWQRFDSTYIWDSNSPWSYQGVTNYYANLVLDPPETWEAGGFTYLHISGETNDLTEFTGERSILNIWFNASSVVDAKFGSIHVLPDQFSLYNDLGIPLFLDDGGWASFTELYLLVKPTKTLNMHIYRVEGSATDQQINDDVQAAEEAFNLNALLCSLGYFVDFVVTITTIPAADWNEIDEDGDGLDRYDRNGDGDYADPGDNNDLFNAMNKGYYDVSPATENIYYVPDIRGGAMGTTYWPNSQVAINNSTDSDNLTLAHEKVHEMDLRKDGDFDVKDGADMNATRDGVQRDTTADGQGAYSPGNLMNYGDTGPLLSGEQGSQLDP